MTKKQSIAWYHPAFLIATWFGIGKVPFAPGTMGSLFTFPLFIASHYLLAMADSEDSFVTIYLLFIAFIYIIGHWATSVYIKRTGKQDPKEVVIDEVVGQIIVFFAAFMVIAPSLKIFDVLYTDGQDVTFTYITTLFTNPPFNMAYGIASLPIYLICFVLFRIFDIWKPWPIGYCDKNIKGAFGVMFDDLFAAMYAVIVLYGIGLLISI